jgi:hypothetical protein
MSWPLVRAAIANVSPVACPYCGPVEVLADEVRERPRICHHYAGCLLYLCPDSDEAVTFAESVDAELGRYLALGTYDDDDMPVHAYGDAS